MKKPITPIKIFGRGKEKPEASSLVLHEETKDDLYAQSPRCVVIDVGEESMEDLMIRFIKGEISRMEVDRAISDDMMSYAKKYCLDDKYTKQVLNFVV